MIFDFIIKKLFRPQAETAVQWPIKARTWAVGGGKGGVGKSFISSAMACALAQGGKRVILVDADLGGANLHTMFGIKLPERTLNDFLLKKYKTMPEIMLPTLIPTLSLICGASDMLELSNPGYAQRKRLIRGLAELQADFVIIDVGAGSSYQNLDFFNAAEVGIIVACPTPTAIQNAYSFLKMALHRRITGVLPPDQAVRASATALLEGDGRVRDIDSFIEAMRGVDAKTAARISEAMSASHYRLIVNMASGEEGGKIAGAMAATAYKHLSVKLPCLGMIEKSPEIDASIRKMEPLMVGVRKGGAVADAIRRVTENALKGKATLTLGGDGEKKHVTIRSSGASNNQSGLNEDVVHDGLTLHVQTEDLGAQLCRIQTLVYSGGRIVFSKSTDYGEIPEEGDPGKAVMEKLLWQHSAIIAGIRAGKLKSRMDRLEA